MQGISARGAGLDVHQKTVGAGVLTPEGHETRPFGTRAAAVVSRADGLLAYGCPPGARARAGDAWTPGFTILAGPGEVGWVNAQHVKAVPGGQTAVQGAAWLAALLPHGWWHASIIPPVAPRHLRDLTRSRGPCSQERVTRLTRVQKLLAEANLTLAAVGSESMGGSGRAILAARLAGPREPQALADVAKGRRRRTRHLLAPALAGRVKPPQRLGLTAL
jgi:transposase